MLFRKKPVVIEAVRWNGAGFDDEKKPAWFPPVNIYPPDWSEAAVRAAVEVGKIGRYTDALHIGTLEGVMTAMPGDWIIRGVKGEIYPCKPDIFAATYEPADKPEQVADSSRALIAELVAALKDLQLGLLSEKPGEDWLSPASIKRMRGVVSAALAKAKTQP